MLKPFPNYTQLDAKDCGPTCLKIIAKHYGKSYGLDYLRKRCFITRDGVSMLGISEAAEQIGFRTLGAKITFNQLAAKAQFPCILYWGRNHFVVCYGIRKRGRQAVEIKISDPVGIKYSMSKEEFLAYWALDKNPGEESGLVLFLVPTPDFFREEEERNFYYSCLL